MNNIYNKDYILTYAEAEDIIYLYREFQDMLLDNMFINLGIKLTSSDINKILKNLIMYVKENSAVLILAKKTRGTVMGFLWAYPTDYYHKKKYHINHLYVKKEFRKQGIGKVLLRQLVIHAEEHNVNVVNLNASMENKNAVDFYLSSGFKVKRFEMEYTINN